MWFCFSVPRLPGFTPFAGSFTEAADEAKRQFRFLLVYLHSEQHHNTAQFCRCGRAPFTPRHQLCQLVQRRARKACWRVKVGTLDVCVCHGGGVKNEFGKRKGALRIRRLPGTQKCRNIFRAVFKEKCFRFN